MADAEHKPQGIMVFDEDELEDNPPQTILPPEDVTDEIAPDNIITQDEEEKEVEKEKPAVVPEPVEEVLPGQDTASSPDTVDALMQQEDDAKAPVKQSVEDIPQKTSARAEKMNVKGIILCWECECAIKLQLLQVCFL